MDEIRKNQIIILKMPDGTSIDGTILDYEKDRVSILVDESSYSSATNIAELDYLDVVVHTHCGIKKMKSHVISALDGRNCILIENNPSEMYPQKREYERVVDDFNFKLIYNNSEYYAKCINISAGGIAFSAKDCVFNTGEKILLIFSKEIFLKEIKIMAEIIKVHDDFFVAKYENLNMYDENKIVQRVFKLLVQK